MSATNEESRGRRGMYSHFQLAQKYLRYYLTASNGKGHGIHSPFVYNLVRKVLNDGSDYPEYALVERLRRQLENDGTLLSIEDLGAGSALKSTRQRSVGELTRHAAKPKKLGQLLFRIARYYQPGTILELGTSLGLSTAYLAMGGAGGSRRVGGVVANGGGPGGHASEMASAGAMGGVPLGVAGVLGVGVVGSGDGVAGAAAGRGPRVFTIEGAPAVAAVAEKNFMSLGLKNIDLGIGNFDTVLEPTLDRAGLVDLAFIDGNHRLEPTLRYFNLLMGRLSSSSVLIFDDIHWSREMEEAWDLIKKDSRVYLTVDLFFIGLVFFRDEFKVKQDFTVRF